MAELGTVRVISYTSAMQFKNARRPLADIARALNVDAIVEGSLESSPGRIHVIAQLAQANPESHPWAASYDRHSVVRPLFRKNWHAR